MYRKTLYFLIIFTLAAAAAAFADTVYLTNGDRLTGTVQGLADGVLSVQTGYGTLEVKAAALAGVTTDRPMRMTLKSGRVYKGHLAWRDNTQFVEAEALKGAAWDDVASVALPTEKKDPAAPAHVSVTDLPAPEKKPSPWSGSVEAGATWRSGQTESLEGHTALNLTRKKEHDTLTLSGSGGYGAVESQVNSRRAKGEGKWQFYPRDGMYYYVLGGLEHDAGRKLDLRANTAGGVGYEFLRKERRKASADLGLEYAREYWNPYDLIGRDKAEAAARAAALDSAEALLRDLRGAVNGGTPNHESALQFASAVRAIKDDPERTVNDDISVRMSGKFEQSIFERSKITNETAFVPNIDDLEAYRLSNDLAFSTPLSEGLSFRLNLKTELDSDIGNRGDAEVDNSLFSTLRYEF